LVILHNDWSSGCRDSSVVLHWSFLHLLTWQVTDFWRRLTSPIRAGSQVICHCLRSARAPGFSGVSHSESQPVTEDVGCQVGDAWDLTLPEPSEWRWRSSRCTCLLPSRCAIPDRTELILPIEFGSWPNQCTLSQGDPVGGERMSDTQC